MLTEQEWNAHQQRAKEEQARKDREFEARAKRAFEGLAVLKDEADRKVAAVRAMIDGDYRNGYRSLQESFVDFTAASHEGRYADLRRDAPEAMFGQLRGLSGRSTESLTTSSWAEVMADSLTRRMIAAYSHPELQSWRKIVSSIVPVNDFRTQRITRIGGYGTLPAVAQGGSYTALTSPTDEEVTYAVNKRGGTEDVTLEMMANDDLRALQAIPVRLGRAAAQTLFRFVWDLLDTNPTIYDSVALFAAGHNNTALTALSGTNLSGARKAMRAQSAYGDTSELLGLTPKILVVAAALEELAWQLSTSTVSLINAGPTASNTPNFHQSIEPIVMDYWSSPTKWIAVADPALCPTIEVGFYQGREEPELFVQNDPSNGNSFAADKITFKVRHIYSGGVLDFRGFYRGNT